MADQTSGARAVEKLIQQFGCLPAAPDGAVLDAFTPEGLGLGLEQEIQRARAYGFVRITVHLDLVDAVKLARFLQRAKEE